MTHPCRRNAAPQRHVALVCRRLRAAANSATVLHSLTISISKANPPDGSGPQEFLEPLRSLCHFVQHVAASHVQQLLLTLRPAPNTGPANWTEAGMLLGSLLQACRGLERLELCAKRGFNLTLSSWASVLTALRRLVRTAVGVEGCVGARVHQQACMSCASMDPELDWRLTQHTLLCCAKCST